MLNPVGHMYTMRAEASGYYRPTMSSPSIMSRPRSSSTSQTRDSGVNDATITTLVAGKSLLTKHSWQSVIRSCHAIVTLVCKSGAALGPLGCNVESP